MKGYSFPLVTRKSGINLAKKLMETATNHVQNAAPKIKKQARKSGKIDKKIMAKVTKAANDLVGGKMADKCFLLKTQKLLPPQ